MAERCRKIELEHHSHVPCQVDIARTSYVEHFTRSGIVDQSAPLEFVLEPDADGWLDPQDIHLHLRVQLRTWPDDAALTQATAGTCDYKFAPINNLGHSLFSHKIIHLGNLEITTEEGHNGYRQEMIDRTSYSPLVKSTRLIMQGYQADEDGAVTKASAGHRKRAERFDLSKTRELVVPLNWDLGDQPALLPPFLGLTIRYLKASPKFTCMAFAAAADAKKECYVKITNASLRARRVQLTPDAALRKHKEMAKGPLYYPIERLITRTLAVPSSVRMHHFESPFQARKPPFLFLGFVASKAYHGDYGENPYNFGQHHIKRITVRLDEQEFPQPATDIDWTNELGTQVYYQQFLNALNFGADAQHHNGITLDEWTKKGQVRPRRSVGRSVGSARSCVTSRSSFP